MLKQVGKAETHACHAPPPSTMPYQQLLPEDPTDSLPAFKTPA